MTKVMYRTGLGQISIIRKVEIERETDSSIWEVGGGTERKKSSYHQYHETADAAKAFLIQQQQARIAHAQGMLDHQTGRMVQLISQLKAMDKITKEASE